MKFFLKSLVAITLIMPLAACQTNSKDQILGSTESQVKLREMQTRVYNTTDNERLLRTIIATMQDLGFVIEKADKELGSITATKLDGYNLKLTATTRPKGKTQTMVRVNATYNIETVEDPEPYQRFFTSLEKAQFLENHQ